MLQSLLGEAEFLAPPGALNRSHLERAKGILDQFAVVIILEDFDEQRVQLRENLNWNISVCN